MKPLSVVLAACLLLTCVSKKDSEFNPTYVPFSKTVIKLEIQNNPTDTVHTFISTNTNIPREGVKSQTLDILNAKIYHLTMEIDRPCVSRLHLNDSVFNIIAIPGDTVPVSIKFNNQSHLLKFEGQWAEINRYLYTKQRTLHYFENRLPLIQWVTSSASYQKILTKSDSITNEALEFLSIYSKNHPLPSWFVDYEQSEITYAGATLKVMMPYLNKSFEYFNDQLPPNYFNFLSSIKINNPKALFSSQYYWFLEEYFIKDDIENFINLGGIDRAMAVFGFIHSKSRLQLSSPVKEIYNQYLFYTIAASTNNRKLLDSLALRLEVPQPIPYDKLTSRTANEGKTYRNLQNGDEVIDFYVADENDSLISIRQFSDKIVYINFWATWCRPCIENIPELNKMVLNYSPDKKVVFLNICLGSEKDVWKKKIMKENMRGYNFIAEGNWATKLTTEFNIRAMPTYVLLKPGNKLAEGNTDKAPGVRSKIDQLLNEESKISSN